jgi:histidinol-phosphate/aromatic aminotransferase/cobyric acid decarboxylase-like protein
MAAAEVAIERFDLLRPAISVIIRERDRLFRALERIPGLTRCRRRPISCLSGLNAPTQLFEALHARGILVRDVSSYPMLAEYIRISIGRRRRTIV